MVITGKLTPGRFYNQRLKWVAGMTSTSFLACCLMGVSLAAKDDTKKSDDKPKTERIDRRTSMKNLKQIGLALSNYHDASNRFPFAAIYAKNDKMGKRPLLSWRVAILPFIEEDKLWKEFKVDEPWDSDHNKKLLPKMPKVYGPSDAKSEHSTFYQAFVGKGAAFEGGVFKITFASFTDGASNTLLVAEAAQAVPWTKPEDLVYDPDKDLPKLGGLFEDGFHVLYADSFIQFIKRDIKPETLRALITRNGGEVVDRYNLLGKKDNKSDEKPAKNQPKLEDFLGKWSGKWDDTYQVRFTISQDPKTKQLIVLYEYEQNLGKPLRRSRIAAKLEGNTLRVGRNMDVTISANDPDKGQAIGRFAERRTADLVREKQ